MPPSEPPFNKWDPSPTLRHAPSTGGAQEQQGQGRDDRERPSGPLRAKMWLLRFAWIVSTGMLVLGALLMILILAGQGHIIGL